MSLNLSEYMGVAFDLDDTLIRILRESEKIVGVFRHSSVHPGGVVISPKPLSCHSPCQRSANPRVITQIDMHGIEAKFNYLAI